MNSRALLGLGLDFSKIIQEAPRRKPNAISHTHRDGENPILSSEHPKPSSSLEPKRGPRINRKK
jgi:hypothetical protein